MQEVRISLLAGFGFIRVLPFIITTYMLFSMKLEKQKKLGYIQWIQKGIACVVGVIINAITFLGVHFYHYHDFSIIGYIKNIWGLNFYHQDIENFAISAFGAIVVSYILGMSLRVFFCNGRAGWVLTKEQEFALFCSGSIAIMLLFISIYAKDFFQSQIVLYEIAGNNEAMIVSGNSYNDDYIELYNMNILPCQIEDLYISDDIYNLKKKNLSGMVVQGKGILIVPCTEGQDSFLISDKGETIYLSDGEGAILETVTFPELETDMAYVKTDIKNAVWSVKNTSPGVNNIEFGKVVVEPPALSHVSGFYDEAFELELSADAGCRIFYTLDGSIPDEQSYLYEDTITVYDKSKEPNRWRNVQNIVYDWMNYLPDATPVPKAFIIRALAVDVSGNKSDIVTASYFINSEQFKDRNIISLIAAPEDLFSAEKGIYVTGKAYDEWYMSGQEGDEPSPLFKKKGWEGEREANIELFCETETIMQQNVGIRLQGASARENVNKRFSIYARNRYSDSNFLPISMFDRETEPQSVVLRDVFADVVCQHLMEDRLIPIQQSEEICLFLNGEYWYDSYIREKYSPQYFEDYYHIEKEQLVLFKSGQLDEGVETDTLLYDELYRYVVEEDFTKEEIYKEFCQMIDVSNYINFLVANIYCANMDLDDVKNIVIWRSREVCDESFSDGRWRWALYDMDAIEWMDLQYYGINDNAEVNSFSEKPQYAAIPYNQGAIYTALRKNDEFCRQFVITFMDLLNENFSIKKASNILQEYGKDITWMNSFFEKRPKYMKEYLAEEFNLTGTVEKVTLCVNDQEGSIQINSIIPMMDNGSWTGEYFTDYPVKITAIEKEGYRFVGWSGSVNSIEKSIEVNIEAGGIRLVAEYEKIE